jgi:hypothetical protein
MTDKNHTTGKSRYDLIPPDALEDVAKVVTMGAAKHGDRDWQTEDPDDILAALYRHVVAYHRGEALDPDSGLHHMAHVATNAMFIAWHDKKTEKEIKESFADYGENLHKLLTRGDIP